MAKNEPFATLAYAVRRPVVLKYLGQLALVLAVLTVAPLVATLAVGDMSQALRYGGVVAMLLATGATFSRLPAPSRIQANEALVITALAFVLSPLLMSYPMMGYGLSFSDAFFEALSGVTTTGLSTLATVEGMAPTFLFARAWMQWYGGLGVVVLSVALLAGHRLASRRLIEQDAESEHLATTVRFHARRMLLVYLALTATGLVALVVLGADLFTALTHALAAVSTGGFAPHDGSLAALPDGVAYGVTGLAACGAVALPVYYLATQGRWRELRQDVELRALLLLLPLVAMAVAMLLFLDGMEWGMALHHGALMGISAQTTAGFSSLPVVQLDAAAKLVLILAMVTGGSVGSTAGGIKLLRLLVLWRLVLHTLHRSALPEHAVAEPRLGGRRLEEDDILRALLLILLFLLVVIASWVPFVLYGYDPLDALFEVVSATGTVGLSTGITQADLPALLKGILCFDMLAGRVEIVALLVVLFPGTWFGKKADVV